MAKKNDGLINATRGAELLGISRPTFNKAVAKGILTIAGQNKSGKKFNPEQLEREWDEYSDYSVMQSRHYEGANRGGRPSNNGAKSTTAPTNEVDTTLRGKSSAEKYTTAKALAATLQAKKLKLEVDQLEGKLALRADMRRDGAELAAIFTGAFAAFPSRVAPMIFGAKSVHDITSILDRELDALIVEVREAIEIHATN